MDNEQTNNVEQEYLKSSKDKTINNMDIGIEPLYIMNLELENESVELKIYENSDPSELASAFCQINKLDYESFEYLKEEINGLLIAYKEKMQNETYAGKEEINKVNSQTSHVKQTSSNKGSNIYLNENKNNFDIIYEEDDHFKGESKDNLNDADLNKLNSEHVKSLKNFDENYESSIKEYIKDHVSQNSYKENLSQAIDRNSSNKSGEKNIKLDEICDSKFINHIVNTNNSNKIEKDISEILSKTNLENYQDNQVNESQDKKSNKFKDKIKEISRQSNEKKINLFPYQQYVKEYNHQMKLSQNSSLNDRIEFKNSSTFKNPFSIQNKNDKTLEENTKIKIRSPSESIKSLSKSKSKSKKSINDKRDVFKELYDEARLKKIRNNFENQNQIQIINNNYNININNFKSNFPAQPLSKSSQKSGVNMYEKRVTERDEQNYKLHVLRKERDQKLMSECSFSPKITEYKNVKSSINDLSSIEIKKKKKEEEIKKIKDKIQTDDHEYTFKPVINNKSKSKPRVYNIQYDYTRKYENQVKINKERKEIEYFKPKTLEEKNKKLLKNSKLLKSKNEGSLISNNEEINSKDLEENNTDFLNRLDIYKDKKQENLMKIIRKSMKKPTKTQSNNSELYIKSDSDQNVFDKNYNYYTKYQEHKEILKNKFEENTSNFHSSQYSNYLFEEKKNYLYKKLFRVLDFDNDNLITRRSVNYYSLSPNLQRLIHDLIKELKDEDETLNSGEFVQAMIHLNNSLNYTDKNLLLSELQKLDTDKHSFYNAFFYKGGGNKNLCNVSLENLNYMKKNKYPNNIDINEELKSTFCSTRMLTSLRLAKKTNNNLNQTMKSTFKSSTNNLDYSFKPSINKKSKILDSKKRKVLV